MSALEDGPGSDRTAAILSALFETWKRVLINKTFFCKKPVFSRIFFF